MLERHIAHLGNDFEHFGHRVVRPLVVVEGAPAPLPLPAYRVMPDGDASDARGEIVSLQKWQRISICGGASRAPMDTLLSMFPFTAKEERILLPLAMSNLALILYNFQ